MGRSKSVFRASTVGLCGGIKKISSCSFSIPGFFSDKGGEGGMPRKNSVLRSLYLRSNSSSLLGDALRLLYLRSNSSSSLLFGIVVGRLRLLHLRSNSFPPTLLPSLSSSSLSSSTLLSSKFVLLLLLSSLLSILFLNLFSLAWISSSLAWPRSCFAFTSLMLFALTWLNNFPNTGFWMSIFFASLNVTLSGIGDSKTPLLLLI